jgi:carbon monoxide dehydrogenase subunit G
MPGIEQIKPLDSRTYQTILKVKIGFFTARFNGEMKVQNIDEGIRRATMLVQGTDFRLASSLQGILDLTLQERSSKTTEAIVTMDLNFLGKLEPLVRPLIKPKVTTMMVEFINRVKAKLDEI